MDIKVDLLSPTPTYNFLPIAYHPDTPSMTSQLPSFESKAVGSEAIASEVVDSTAVESQAIEPEPLISRATVIVAPDRKTQPHGRTVFLAGSIDMGKAEKWQDVAIKRLKDLEITIYNPRRDDWDPTWKQEKSFPPFYDQVTWELKALEEVDVIMLYLSAGSAAPISLLELGTFGSSKRMVVGCPKGFYRRGNVEIVCERYDIELVGSFDELVVAARRRLLEPAKAV